MRCARFRAAAAALAVVMTACGGGGAVTGSPADPSPATPSSKPLIDYKTPLIAAAAGQYTGECESSVGQPVDVVVTIHANGSLSLSTGGTAQINTSWSSAGWSRSFDPRDEAAGFFAGHSRQEVGTASVELSAGAVVPMFARIGDKAVWCRKVAPAAALVQKSSYQAAAQFLDTTKTTLRCLDGLARTDLGLQSYEIQDGNVTILGDTFSLLGPLKKESVAVQGLSPENAHSTTLHYIARLADGKELSMFLDAYGDLRALSYSRGPDHLAQCGLAK